MLKGKIRKIMDFNRDWIFRIDSDKDWKKVNLPHDYAIECGYEEEGDSSQGFFDRWHRAVYRKTFEVGQIYGKRYVILFDGVMSNSQVLVNGFHVGGRPYGYVPFLFDITDQIVSGSNIIEVSTDNSVRPADRWYSGAGIYRNVKMIITNELRFGIFGTAICSAFDSEGVVLKIENLLESFAQKAKLGEVETIIYDPSMKEVARSRTKIFQENQKTSTDFTVRQKIRINIPVLWSIGDPRIYTAHCTLYDTEGVAVDDIVQTFGIRKIRLDSSEGMFLNEKPIKLKGVNFHHDGGCVGAAVPEAILVRRFEALKEIGCNAIRCAHNPPSTEFLDLCDRMGFLVIDEAFDKWTWKQGNYHFNFSDWWQSDLEAMIKRDRNHPCVFMWSVGNEVENQGSPEMLDILKMLTDYVRSIDPCRPVTCALEPHCHLALDLLGCSEVPVSKKAEITARMADHMDILSCNYQEQWYGEYRKVIPDKLIIGSETYAYFRGDGNDFFAHKEMSPWFDVKDNNYVIGQFVWPGIDYLGESVDFSVRGLTAGLIDMAGFIKPAGYFYKSLWRDEPMIYACVRDISRNYYWSRSMFGHWSWPNVSGGWNFPWAKNSMVEINIYTNCEEVEISVNDGVCTRLNKSDFLNGIIRHYKAYSEGVCEINGFINGVCVQTERLVSTGRASTLELVHANKSGEHTVVECLVKDDDGNLVMNEDIPVEFVVSGEGSLIGTDNGDMTDFTKFSSAQRMTFQGRCIAVLKTDGPTHVVVKSEGMDENEQKI